jgi:hypothetical protein
MSSPSRERLSLELFGLDFDLRLPHYVATMKHFENKMHLFIVFLLSTLVAAAGPIVPSPETPIHPYWGWEITSPPPVYTSGDGVYHAWFADSDQPGLKPVLIMDGPEGIEIFEEIFADVPPEVVLNDHGQLVISGEATADSYLMYALYGNPAHVPRWGALNNPFGFYHYYRDVRLDNDGIVTALVGDRATCHNVYCFEVPAQWDLNGDLQGFPFASDPLPVIIPEPGTFGLFLAVAPAILLMKRTLSRR